jgi:hypothetical protein
MSPFGTSRHFAATQQFSRFRSNSPSLARVAERDVAKSTSVLKLDLIAFRRKILLRESGRHASAMDAKREQGHHGLRWLLW